MPSSFLPPVNNLNNPSSSTSMHPYGKSTSANPGQPTSANGSKPTSPNVPTSQPASRNGISSSSSTPGGGNELRPSYAWLDDARKARAREIEEARVKAQASAMGSIARPSNASSTSTPASSQTHPSALHNPHATPGSNPPSTSSTPREERPNPYGSNSTPSGGAPRANRGPDISNTGYGAGLGRMGAGYGLFGVAPFRDQDYREKDRQFARQLEREREQQRERERERERENNLKRLPIATSPTRTSANLSNSFSRPSLPPSPTTSRTLAPPGSANSAAGKPSISPQITPGSASSATGSTPRPNLPLPGFGSLGTRSLPSPFERDARERSTSASVAPSPNLAPGQESTSIASGHRRTPSNSSARGPETSSVLNAAGPKSPVKTTAQTASTARSLYGAPPSLGDALRAREAQRSPVSTLQGAVPPKDRDSAISPTTGTAPKSATPGSATTSGTTPAAGTQNNRGPYNSYTGFGGPAYPGSFGGFGLGGFGGYGAFGPRWGDRGRERETAEQREKREEERKRREKEIADVRARAEKEREERDVRWLQARERERERANVNATAKTAYAVEAFQPPRSNTVLGGNPVPSAQRAPAADPYRRQASVNAAPAVVNDKIIPARHIEVIHQPEQKDFGGPTAPIATTTTAADGSSVIQQVAPTREPRPYGYKAEPREYQYTPRDKRPRMDAAVEDAQNAHRRTSNAKASKRRKEEEKKAETNTNPPIKEKDWAALTNPVRKWPEVKSGQVERWLKTVPNLDNIISHEVYTGEGWNLAKNDDDSSINREGGLIVVRIGGGFLGENWKVRGENGWDNASCVPPDNVFGFGGKNDKSRKIWGTDVYTDDSSLGLILIHAGWLRWSSTRSSSPLGSPSINGKPKYKRDQDVINVTVRIVPKLIRYTATERNGIRTRSWGNSHDGSSVVVERVERIDINKIHVKSCKRKSGISEWTRERQVAAPLPISNFNEDDPTFVLSQDEIDSKSVKLCNSWFQRLGEILKFEAGFAYTPEALEGWLDNPGRSQKTLWEWDLTFTEIDDVEGFVPYTLSLSDKSSIQNPLFNLSQKYQSSDKPEQKLQQCKDKSFDDLYLLPEGLAVRTEGNKGLLLKFKMYNWDEKRKDLIDEWKDMLREDRDEYLD